ncbi:hypothetical protein GUITHDRAFT_150734 [Guillardia theta CCMP2712]|uniref:Uncharacterized protein n=1 Tax=Guillardia theta (strain CCMP2712) TaxID=905079 RepID=L1JVA9_GUITC|nr:hypothetical protein GUITHDRAFT_150734 [Guillardia theta CCMP2712]EKX52254.1 hypothetical protein GUITHDRAFT_150734 [Guillardia theta CCMP2712]|eukprot:XP_005839234.1 hypothetical protein GUITHDRAFT_150734 [Guillardia theta CCMP2712]
MVRMSEEKWSKLMLSIVIDIIGILSYLIPVIAEFFDVFWAPLSSLLVFQMYGNRMLSGIAFIEEILPFTDIFPTATFGWLCQFTALGKWLGIQLEQPVRPNPRFRRMD